jgi:hypothetical protein
MHRRGHGTRVSSWRMRWPTLTMGMRGPRLL